MKRSAAIILALLALVGCGNSNSKTTETNEMVENGEIGYSDIVSFIVQGYQCGWKEMSPSDHGLGALYLSCSPDCGFARMDVNGDGIDELLLGKEEENGTYKIFDMWTIDPADGSLMHLASGDDRDWYCINGSGTIIENHIGLKDSFQKGWEIEEGRLVKIKADAWNDDLRIVEFEKFADKVESEMLCGGYTPMRKVSDEEFAMLKAATDDDGMIIYTPLEVATQVVAGTNYKFWCIWDDLGYDHKENEQPAKAYGYCWVTVFKPLPGQGDPSVTSIEKVQEDVAEAAEPIGQ